MYIQVSSALFSFLFCCFLVASVPSPYLLCLCSEKRPPRSLGLAWRDELILASSKENDTGQVTGQGKRIQNDISLGLVQPGVLLRCQAFHASKPAEPMRKKKKKN